MTAPTDQTPPLTRPNFRSRIVGAGEEAPDQLLANPRNWRVHPKYQQDALESVLDTVGWVQNIIVNRTTGFVLDGHARVAIALRREEPKVPVVYVELSEAEEALVLATYDPISALAGKDDKLLGELVAEVQVGDQILRELMDDLLPDVREPSDAAALALMDLTTRAPAYEVTKGSAYRVGQHLLLVLDPVRDWAKVHPWMREGDWLLPFPGVYAPLVEEPPARFVMVQPDLFVAAFIADRYEEQRGKGTVTRVETPEAW
jgi:hypothetical protein